MRIKKIFAIATVLALAAAIGAPSASAQSVDLRANIPFDFYAAGKLFPAGTYRLSQVNPVTLRLHGSGDKSAFISAGREATNREDQSWFVFNQYGKVTFLAGAYWSGSGASLRVPASRAEQEIARNGGKPSPLSIAVK